MSHCLICKREEKICDVYGISEYSAKDLILRFCGPVEEYLNAEQGICKTCLCLLNSLLNVRKFMNDALGEPADNSLEDSFAQTFKSFGRVLEIFNYDDIGDAGGATASTASAATVAPAPDVAATVTPEPEPPTTSPDEAQGSSSVTKRKQKGSRKRKGQCKK